MAINQLRGVKKSMATDQRDADDEFESQVVMAWLKDTRERGSEAVKRFREQFQKGVTERDFCLKSQRLGVNSAGIIAQNLVRQTTLQKIDLYENLVRDAGCEMLAGLVRESPTLTHLNLGGNDIGPAGAGHLAAVVAQHAKKLQVLILGSGDSDMHVNRIDAAAGKALAEALRKNKTVRHVDLNRNPLGKGDQDAFESFAALVEGNNHLKVLRLGSTTMSTDSGQYLVSKLASSNVLEELDLHSNDLGYQVAEKLAQVLQDKRSRSQKSHLRRLLLQNNPRLGERGAAPLCNALAESSILHLNLSDAGVTDDAAITLAESLRSSRLQHVDLSRNYITHVGCIALAQQLEVHDSLLHLSLSQNKVRCEGAAALAATLESNQMLATLCLEESWIGDEGAVALGVALASNAALGILKLTGNHISDEAGRAFATLVERNKTVHTILVRGNQVDHSTVLRLKRILKRNKELKENEEPNRLQKEVIRLHYQQCKLHEASQELKVHKQARQKLQDEIREQDGHLLQEQGEAQKQMKEFNDRIARYTADIQEAHERREQLESGLVKSRHEAEEQLDFAQKALKEKTADREAFEVELAEKKKELEELQAGLEHGRKKILAEIDHKKKETEAFGEQYEADRAKLSLRQEELVVLEEKDADRRADRDKKAAEARAARAKKDAEKAEKARKAKEAEAFMAAQ